MDKASERKKDSKAWGDTDVGTERTFGKCNVRAELEGLWDHAPKEVVGQGLGRLLTNDYCKQDDGKASTEDMVDAIVNGSPPYANVSKPKVIL
jgi:hypothetical protein